MTFVDVHYQIMIIVFGISTHTAF